MKIIVCVDDNYGMMFNHRRQSRDSLLISDVVEMAGDYGLWMNAYSAKLFEDEDVLVEEAFLLRAEEKEFCFVEDQLLQPYLDKVNEIILYRWNRKYPADFYLDLDMSEWKKMDEKEFAGSSHEKITRERYIKEEE